MKKNNLLLIALVAISTFFAACAGENTEAQSNTTTPEKDEKVETTKEIESHDLNLESSGVNWTGSIAAVKDHTGTLNFKSGSFDLQGDKVVGGNFVIDMSTMVATDSNFDEEKTKEGLIGHLSSADFFDVANHPTASYTISGMEGNVVNGKMTIRGKTNDVQIENVTVIYGQDGTIKLNGDATLDRQAYGVAFSMGMKDMFISDDINIKVNLQSK